MSLHAQTIPQLAKMLQNLDRWLDKAEAYAKTKKFEPDTLLAARLAPDQYPLVRQVQSACDTAKFLGARLSGKEAPKHPDTEQTMAELHARIASARAFVESVSEADLKGAETRVVVLPFMPGKGLLGADYANEMALPNFYFHVTTAYAILRHNGVDVGKMDYIGSLNMRDV
jgi:uncharacterized protein